MESLRDQQRRLARDRILEALATEIAENGLLDLSIPAIADRAGVSQRTIYNYFDTKEALVGSLEQWSEEWMEQRGGPLVERDLDKVPEALIYNYDLFDKMGDLATALARIRADALHSGEPGAAFGSGHMKRTEAIRDALAEIRPDLDDDELRALTGILRLVIGFDMWNRLTKEYGLSGADAGRVAGWVHAILTEAVRRGEGPFRPGEQ
jgi:AcrR family transcriptional regulator